MTIDQLKYFIEISKTKSMSKAARNLYISQSALSQSIDQLEEELNLKLLVRDANGSRLTVEGVKILEYARNVLDSLDNLETEARLLQEEISSFKLGVSNELFASFADGIIDFQKRDTQFQLSVIESTTENIIQGVEDENFDLGFIVINQKYYSALRSLNFSYLLPARFNLYMSVNHPLAKKEAISSYDLKKQKFVIFNDEFIDDFIRRFDVKYGKLNVLVRTTAFKLVIDFIKSGEHVSIIRDTQFDNNLSRFDTAGLVSFDLSEFYAEKFALGWLVKPTREFNQIETAFIEKLSDSLLQK